MAKTIWLHGPSQRDYAHKCIDAAEQGWVVKIGEPTRSDAQNRILHARIADIQRQVPDMARYTVEDCKLRFMAALRLEMRMLPELDGAGFFPVGLKTSTLSKSQFNALLTLMDEWAGRNGVVWTAPDDCA